MRSLTILVSAYSCEPHRGSEPGVGWNMAVELARHHHVWVLTRPDESGPHIDAELARHPNPNLHFVYCTTPLIGGLWRWGSGGAMQIHYYFWQLQAYFTARRLLRTVKFDAIHHITFVKYSTPSFLALLPVPFFFGPVGGGESAPPPFWRAFSFKARLYEWARSLTRWIGEQDPFTRLTVRRSAIAFATTPETEQRLTTLGAPRTQILAEAALSAAELDTLQPRPPAARPRFLSVGRLLHWKGYHLSIAAFAAAQLGDCDYWLLGTGPETATLQGLIDRLGVGDRVQLLGRQPRSHVLDLLTSSYAFVHPSLHDSGGWACLEAMAAGLPVLCLDLGGPATEVTAATGFKIAAQHPEQVIQDLAAAMGEIVSDRTLRDRLGQGGRDRIKSEYTWSQKVHRINTVYREILG
ncbi:glycosyltransferase family 4 protein [Spirulina major]|uniref:glycosyltransferase family 4 protein n=1 Tax=Spirulina major TaxID=270636 RepID=UPI0009330804|nr:glycosyltransferase [Spirulina major]